MMKMTRLYMLIFVVFALLVAACSSGPQARPDEGVPKVAPPLEVPDVELPEEIPLVPLSDFDPRSGKYKFSMSATFDNPEDSFSDTFTSEWGGSFTIDSKGNIEGEGNLNFLALSYLKSESTANCGYVWRLEGDYKFDIGGTVLPGENNIPIILLSVTLLAGSEIDGPNQICPSELDKVIHLPQFQGFGLGRRDAMLDAIIGQLNFGFIVLYADVPFNKELGAVAYIINIKYIEPLLEPLDQ